MQLLLVLLQDKIHKVQQQLLLDIKQQEIYKVQIQLLLDIKQDWQDKEVQVYVLDI